MPLPVQEGPTPSYIQAHKGYDVRLRLFYGILAALMVVLVGGMAYRQLYRTGQYEEQEKVQSLRRVILPGPRGNIYDRNGELLVGNRPRYGAVLYLDELRPQFHREYLEIRRNYREAGDKDIPTAPQLEQIARYQVVQGFLDQISRVTGRQLTLDADALKQHFRQQLLLPFPLVEDLAPEEFAKLVEGLPPNTPLQLFAASARLYPHGSAAAHVLGYVGPTEDVDAQGLPGEDLTTFKLKGTRGRDGLERQYDELLQGQPGSTIFRVDPAGYRINPPLEEHPPTPGHDFACSIDLDLETAAESALGDQIGAAVALDVRTGEVLVMASKPDYSLSDFSPFLSKAAGAAIEENQAWPNRAITSFYPPGSTFKIVTTVAALRSGAITPDETIADCEGSMRISGHTFTCENGLAHHGRILLPEAIAESCDIYFYTAGILTTVDELSAEARRFHLDDRTGIDLPHEPKRMLIPDGAWKKKERGEAWFPGDTANMSIGQGFVLLSPIQLACFAASVARGETLTQPTLRHDPNRPGQHSEAIGLTESQRAALLKGMEECTTIGTAKMLSAPAMRIPGLRIAGKTGTAQIPGKKNVAWFICFAPLEHPEIAIAVAAEGDTPGENYAGGLYAAPVAQAILKVYFQKKTGHAEPARPGGAHDNAASG
ncbi:peptidoglycan glycosyltransferase [Opitutaceae bacterium EW11]|nr:peptidoglycan glycosyltransferase [Opitutaceae bacterium EW11]